MDSEDGWLIGWKGGEGIDCFVSAGCCECVVVCRQIYDSLTEHDEQSPSHLEYHVIMHKPKRLLLLKDIQQNVRSPQR